MTERYPSESSGRQNIKKIVETKTSLLVTTRQTGHNELGQTKEVFMEVLVVPLTSVGVTDAGCCLLTLFDYSVSFYILAIGYGYWET
jgi:hypothetical protein